MRNPATKATATSKKKLKINWFANSQSSIYTRQMCEFIALNEKAGIKLDSKQCNKILT